MNRNTFDGKTGVEDPVFLVLMMCSAAITLTPALSDVAPFKVKNMTSMFYALGAKGLAHALPLVVFTSVRL